MASSETDPIAGMNDQLSDDKVLDNARETEKEDFKWLMEDPRGRRFIWRILSMAGVFQNSFTGDNETFFREGKRVIGTTMIAEIHTLCPEKYFEMVKEQTPK